MHTYVHCGTVYNSKNLEPTHMPIKGRLDKENVAYIHHGILCSHKKWVHVLCRNMDEAGNHHSQQTDTRTENQTHCMFSLLSWCWTMRTHGHREKNITHWGCWTSGWWGTSEGIGLGEYLMYQVLKPRWEVDGCSKPRWYMYTFITNLQVLHMYPRT